THLVALGDQIILMRSGAKFIGLERASGEVSWSRIETNSYLRTLEFHERGIICGGWNTLQCLAPADGVVLWTTTNELWTAAEIAISGNDLLLAYRAPAPPAETDTAQPKEETLTAGGGFKIDARSILAAARGE
ncbi:MAG: hypothetical protein GTO53_13995, partial [Planctomycetales bacterium]|nr:hypothetical protein [Planctomycetales bacterium]